MRSHRSVSILAAAEALLAVAQPRHAEPAADTSTQADKAPAKESAPSTETTDHGTPIADYWLDHYAYLDFNPVGFTQEHKGVVANTLTPIHPSGLPADEYYSLLGIPGATYGFGHGLQAEVAVTGLQQRGGPGEATFYGLGLQKRLFGGKNPGDVSVAVGGYGYLGPRSYNGGMVYLAASKRIFGDINTHRPALFLHTGVKMEAFNNEHLETLDGRRRSSGVQPYVGANLTLGSRLFLVGEFAPGQAWEPNNQFTVRAQYFPVARHLKVLGISGTMMLGVTGGIRNTGYRTHGLIGPTFDFHH